MMRSQSTVIVPLQIGALLSQITETPDLETALRQVLASYIGYKQNLPQRRTGSNRNGA